MQEELNYSIDGAFQLNSLQSALLVCAEVKMIDDQIKQIKSKKLPNTKKGEHRKEKLSTMSSWRTRWISSMSDYLSSLGCDLQISPDLISSIQKRIDASEEYSDWKYLILLECTFFHPFDNKDFINSSVFKKSLVEIANTLGVNDSFPSNLLKVSNSAYDKLTSNIWKKLEKDILITLPFMFLPFGNLALIGRLASVVGREAAFALISAGVINISSKLSLSAISSIICGAFLFSQSVDRSVVESCVKTDSSYVLQQLIKAYTAIKVIYYDTLFDAELIESMLSMANGQLEFLSTLNQNVLNTEAKNNVSQCIKYYTKFTNMVKQLSEGSPAKKMSGNLKYSEARFKKTDIEKRYRALKKDFNERSLIPQIEEDIQGIRDSKIAIKEGALVCIADKLRKIMRRCSCPNIPLEAVSSIDDLLSNPFFYKDIKNFIPRLETDIRNLDIEAINIIIRHKELDKAMTKLVEYEKELEKIESEAAQHLRSQELVHQSLSDVSNNYHRLKKLLLKMIPVLDPVEEYCIKKSAKHFKELPDEALNRVGAVWTFYEIIIGLAKTDVTATNFKVDCTKFNDKLSVAIDQAKTIINQYA